MVKCNADSSKFEFLLSQRQAMAEKVLKFAFDPLSLVLVISRQITKFPLDEVLKNFPLL